MEKKKHKKNNNNGKKQEKQSLVRRILNSFRSSERKSRRRSQEEKSESQSIHVEEDHELLFRLSPLSTSGGEECTICFKEESSFPELSIKCSTHQRHHVCKQCLYTYFKQEIDEGRLPKCMYCSEVIPPSDILSIVDSTYKEKYDQISVRQYLLSEPDARFCPRPDCKFALIATEFASCPKIQCQECQTDFCYHCRQVWHPNQPCDQLRFTQFLQFRPPPGFPRIPHLTSMANSTPDIKPCPRCNSLISKMDDGSCNHMTCRCGAEFCWLCLKEISDLHYLSPSGCTFWGKQVWSKKKIIIWQIGTLVLAPPMIALMAAVAVPATIVGVPIYVGTTARSKLKKLRPRMTKRKRSCLVVLASSVSFILSPLVAALTVAIGTPIVVLYVYGIIPFTIMRTGGCGYRLRRGGSGDSEEEQETQNEDEKRQDWVSINPSDDISVQGLDSQTVLPGEVNSASGDVASTMALASFCSNSINESAIAQENSTNASITSRGLCRKIPALERSLTPVSRSETINEEKNETS